MIQRVNPAERELLKYIKKDTLDEVMLLVDSTFSVDHKLSFHLIQKDKMISDLPPLISVAAYYRSVNVFRYFIASGADLTAIDRMGRSVVEFAIRGGSFEILHLLDENDVSFKDMLFTAAECGNLKIFLWIYFFKSENIHQRRFDGLTVAHIASLSGNFNLMKFIFDILKNDLTISDMLTIKRNFDQLDYYSESESESESSDSFM